MITSSPNNIHYRIYVINSFTNVEGCLEYHSYGAGRIENFASFKVSGPRKSFQEKSDCIEIRFNYEQLGVFKEKEEAKKILLKLIEDCPKQCKKDFEDNSWEILNVIEKER